MAFPCAEQCGAVGARPQTGGAEVCGPVVGGVRDRERHDRAPPAGRQDPDSLRGAARADVAEGTGVPRRTTRGSACASGGAGAAVTSKLDATARWSEPQGTPTSTSGPPGSPTSRLASVVAGPVTVTQSIRSSVSRRRMRGGGVPAVQVSPGRSHRVRVRLAVRVAEPSVGERGRHRPAQRVFHLRPHGSHGGRPIQVRRGVEVAGEERRHAAGALPGQRPEVRADLAEPGLALVLQHLGRDSCRRARAPARTGSTAGARWRSATTRPGPTAT